MYKINLVLATVPTTHVNVDTRRRFVRIIGYHRPITNSGFRKGPDRKVCAFAYGDTAQSIHHAAKKGKLSKGKKIRVELFHEDKWTLCSDLSF